MGDKIETAEDYIVDEPVTPELAPGVTVQDNQAKALATSTGTTIEEIPAVTEKADSIPEKPKKKPTKIKDEKDAVEPVGGFKLKKAKTGKRQIEEAEVEKITLKRHEFESIPCEEEPEKETGVILSNPIITEKVDSIPEKPKKKPKKIKEPIQEKDAVEPELAPGVTVQDNQAKASATSTGSTIEEIPAVTEKVDSIPEKTKKKPTKVKEPVQEKDAVEPVGGFKLKKAQTGKRQIEEAEVEKITLKCHEFESIPHEEEPEKETGVILSNPIITEKVDSIPEKPKKKPKKIKEP